MEASVPDHRSGTRTAASGTPPSPAFGAYRLLQRIGEGGMGEVWLAEQTHPVRRQVALKIIKAGMDTAQVVARFEAERQALALMDHPAIATVFDGGSTPEGRPYFAMEYVKGEPITAYCDRQRMGTKERLELFTLVCEGVQHAHQKGIIHRDLKPSNVLVTLQDDRPVPKIIDFGVAKATTLHLTERSLFTELGVLIGTPEYMSPEQAELTGLDIDTRTDVYALGVLLYELLTGWLPFDRKELRRAGLVEIQRIIRETEPLRPSNRITQLGPASMEVAHNRHTEPTRLASQLRRDLDWITMKALEKDRTRRYDTVRGLANDVRRHLRNEPVVASPPSAVYRARKFVRRHRFGVASVSMFGFLLVAFAVAMAVQAQRVARERDRANQEAEAAKQVTAFMTGLFKVSAPGEARGNTVTAREILDKGVERIDTELVDQPLIQARMMTTMGQVYFALGLERRAEQMQRNALATRQRLLGARAPETLQSLHSLGAVLMAQGYYVEAEPFAREALDGRHVVLGPNHPNTLESLNNLTLILFNLGQWPDAEKGFRELLMGRERSLGAHDQSTLAAASNLAAVLQAQGKLAEADALYKRALTGLQTALGRDHPRTLTVHYNLGTVAERQERWTEADSYYVAALEGRRRVLGADHPETITTAVALATLRHRQQRFDEAESLGRDALTRARWSLGPRHEVTASALVSLGSLLNARAEYNEARSLLEEGLNVRRALMPDTVHVAAAECELGESLRGRGLLDEAEALLIKGCSGVNDSTDPSTAEKRVAVSHVVALYEALGRVDRIAEWRAKLPKEGSGPR
jgi:non-specific serine/threonine protein kinase/serine/threonine-protein kinase